MLGLCFLLFSNIFAVLEKNIKQLTSSLKARPTKGWELSRVDFSRNLALSSESLKKKQTGIEMEFML